MGAIDTTYTFAANDIITSTKMNNIIDQTSFTSDAVFDTTLAVSLGKLKVNAQGITSNEMAVNSVRTDSIEDLSVTGAKLANNSITNDKLEASIGLARATLKAKTAAFQANSGYYKSISALMAIVTSGGQNTVTVTCASPHGYLSGEPFFIYVSTGSISYYIGNVVDSVISANSFTFKTTSTTLPAGGATIYYFDPIWYSSRNIKKVHPGRADSGSGFIQTVSGVLSFNQWTGWNQDFNATFNTPLVSVDNACILGSYHYLDFISTIYFNFYSPSRRSGYASGAITTYNSTFSVAVFT